MAITYVGRGSDPDSNNSPVTPTVHADSVAGDLLIEVVVTKGWHTELEPTLPSGEWTKLYTARSSGAINNLNNRQTVFWCWFEDLISTTTSDVGNYLHSAVVTTWRGVDPNTPFEAHLPAANILASNSTTVTHPALTTTVPNALKLLIQCNARSGALVSSATNANLIDLVEHGAPGVYIPLTGTNQAHLHFFSGTKEAPGSTGTTSMVNIDNSWWTAGSVGLIPEVATAATAGLTLMGVG